MYDFIDQLQLRSPYYLLVFCRISAMLSMLPIFGFVTVPGRIRILLALVLTLTIAPMLVSKPLLSFHSVLALVIAMAWEVWIGLIIGFGARMLLEAFSLAGSFVSLQMGIGMMNVVDPTSEVQQPIIGQFWGMVAMIFLLVTDTHYMLIETLYQNFFVIKLSGGTFTPFLGRTMVQGFSGVLEMALRLAAPSVVLLLLVDVALAFVSRVMPQLNIFFVSLPLKIAVGSVMVILSIRIFQVLFSAFAEQLQTFIWTIVQSI